MHWHGHVQDLESKATSSMSQAMELVESAPPPMRTAVLSHFADLGEKPNWKTHPEQFTFWASQLLNLQSGDKLLVCQATSNCIAIASASGGHLPRTCRHEHVQLGSVRQTVFAHQLYRLSFCGCCAAADDD